MIFLESPDSNQILLSNMSILTTDGKNKNSQTWNIVIIMALAFECCENNVSINATYCNNV
jgi:hypothetical protein